MSLQPTPRLQRTGVAWHLHRRQSAAGPGLSSGVQYTVDEWCWEVPAGSLKSGQSIEDAAQEELREEVGGEAGLLHYVGRFFMANGICSEVGHIFLATGVTLGETHHESAEVISVHMVSPAEAVDMARTGKISDGPTALAILLCANRPDFFRPDGP